MIMMKCARIRIRVVGRTVSVVALAAAVALGEAVAGTFDWTTASGIVTVPPGETYVATQADMTAVNALSGIVVSGATDAAPAGVLEFRDCTTTPKEGLLHGEGVVMKTGGQVWTLDVANPEFNGDFRICGGQIVNTADKSFGMTSAGCKGAVYVEPGASLVIDSTSVRYAYRPLHLAGDGLENSPTDKALVVRSSAWPSVGRLVLDADATVYVHDNNNYYWLYHGTPASVVELGDHTLTKTGPMNWYLVGSTFVGGNIVNAQGDVVVGSGCDLGDGAAGPLAFAGSARMTFYEAPSVVFRPMRVDGGTVRVDYSTGNPDEVTHPLLTTNLCNWAGDVALNGAASRLHASHTFANASVGFVDRAHDVQLSFMGNVSGEGSVQIGSDNRLSKGRYALGGHNTYTGTTLVYGGLSSRLYAYWHDSIPDYARLTVDRGYVAARAGTAEDGKTEFWPKERLMALRRAATFKGDGALAVDAECCADGTFALTAAELKAGDSRPDVGWGVAGGTVRISANLGERLPLAPCAYRGTLELTGPGTFVMAGTNAIVSVAGAFTNGATVAVRGGATVEQGDLPVFVGCLFKPSGAQTPSSYGRLLVAGARWLSTTSAEPSDLAWSSLHDNALYVGSMLNGILDIQSGGVVSNKLVVGGGGCDYSVAVHETQGSADGAVYVGTGGRLFVRAGAANPRLASQIGHAGYGYLQVDEGAEATIGEGPVSVGLHGLGVFHQYGGTFVKRGTLTVGGDENGHGVIYVGKGAFRTESAGTAHVFPGTGKSSRAFVTVDGPDAEIEVGGSDSTFYVNQWASAATRINLNNGGRLVVDRFYSYKTAAEMESAHALIISFDGGVLKKRKDHSDVLTTGHHDAITCAVYAGGAAFDSANRADCVWPASNPIVGHVSGGVQAIDASTAVAMDWIGAPAVVIAGDGVGATAVADWDAQTRKLKGIRITSRGWGYSAGNVTVTVKTSQRSVAIGGAAVTVGDNDIGGFTKLGANTLTVCSTNSWQKWTAVADGTLRVGSNGAIPPNTELRLNGGTLDLNGFDADPERPVVFAGVSGTGGRVVNGVAKVAGVWTISAKRFIDRETTAVSGAIDLTGVTKIVFTDVELLDGEAPKALPKLDLLATSAAAWPTDLAVEGLPVGWEVKASVRGLRMGVYKGTVLIVR